MIRFIVDYPVAFIPEEKLLVVADLHLGLENELYKSGITIFPQGEKFRKTLDILIKVTRAENLVIVGDVKHEVPGITFRETKEIPKMFSHLIEKVKVFVCIGNHDTYIKEILPQEVKIYSSRGFKIGKYGFFHGHAWPSKKLMLCDWLFMGHIHPSVEFVDSLGFRNIEQVWIKGRLNADIIKQKYKIKKTGKLELIILPTFNKLLGGLAINSKVNEELIGPLLANKSLDIEKSKVYLLDGTFLGNTKQLKR